MEMDGDQPPAKRQCTLKRFWKPEAALTPSNLRFVNVQAVKSRHVRAPDVDVVDNVAGSQLVQLETALVAVANNFETRRRGRAGRPRVAERDLRGVAGGVDRSNRLMPGMQRRRQDISPWEGLKIFRFMETSKTQFADEESWRRHVYRRYRPKPWRALKGVYDKGGAYWEQRVRDSGIGAGTRGTLNRRGQNLKHIHRMKMAKGCRAKGAGRPDEFKIFKVALKEWVHLERRNGNPLDSSDLLEQFKYMLGAAVKIGEAAEAKGRLHDLGRAKLLEYKGRLEMLKKVDYAKNYRQSLQKATGCLFLKPQRQLKLTFAEEQLRCKLTWQMLDRKIWEAAFGGEAGWKRYSVAPHRAAARVKECVLGFSDQVPWWGMIARPKQLYCEED